MVKEGYEREQFVLLRGPYDNNKKVFYYTF